MVTSYLLLYSKSRVLLFFKGNIPYPRPVELRKMNTTKLVPRIYISPKNFFDSFNKIHSLLEKYMTVPASDLYEILKSSTHFLTMSKQKASLRSRKRDNTNRIYFYVGRAAPSSCGIFY